MKQIGSGGSAEVYRGLWRGTDVGKPLYIFLIHIYIYISSHGCFKYISEGWSNFH